MLLMLLVLLVLLKLWESGKRQERKKPAEQGEPRGWKERSARPDEVGEGSSRAWGNDGAAGMAATAGAGWVQVPAA